MEWLFETSPQSHRRNDQGCLLTNLSAAVYTKERRNERASCIGGFMESQMGVNGFKSVRPTTFKALSFTTCNVYASLMKRQPTGFVFEVCDGARLSARQDRLVLEYEPFCNRHSAEHP